MQPIVADSIWPVEMPFRAWTRVGPKNHILGVGLWAWTPIGRGNILGGGGALVMLSYVKLLWPFV